MTQQFGSQCCFAAEAVYNPFLPWLQAFSR